MLTPTKMRLLPEYISAIRDGRKRTTIRLGKRKISTSDLTFKSNSNSVKVHVLSVTYRKFSEFTELDAQRDGFDTLNELQTALNRFYGIVEPNTVFTVIEFKL